MKTSIVAALVLGTALFGNLVMGNDGSGDMKGMKGMKHGSDGKAAVKKQTICPVTNEKLKNMKYYVDVKGKRIFVCCKNCISVVKKNPEKYLKKIVADKITQKKCPVMGRKINPKLYYKYKNQKIYVCCPGCVAAVKKNPEKYLKRTKKMMQSKKSARK